MGRRLNTTVMVGDVVYPAGTDECEIKGEITAPDVWEGEASATVDVSVVGSEELQKAADALNAANATIDELRARVAELEASLGDGSEMPESPYGDLDLDGLKAEIDRRNEGREGEARIAKRGGKEALVAALVADDEAKGS